MTFVPIVLAGGSGSHLWPTSRELHPKQFLDLLRPGVTMLQLTFGRLDGLTFEHPIVLCNEEHRFLAAEQLRQLNQDAQQILEPAARNTAPAIALAALHAASLADDPMLLVLPADHAIDDTVAFHASLDQARRAADEGQLVTFGVQPTYPETGYGYIKQGPPLPNAGFQVQEFLEKPDQRTAEGDLNTRGYLWNSGMFMFSAVSYLEELGRCRPNILQACEQAISASSYDMGFLRPDSQAFLACPAESIDHAVMEHTGSAAVVPLDAGWRDLGSWSALWEVLDKDTDGNAITGDVLVTQTTNSLVRAESRLVATLGMKDVVIVETKDAVLVADSSHAQAVKQLAQELEARHRGEWLNHREVYRPWGVYDSVDHGERYQVKRITVEPGRQLSVQMHHHRAEHWVVVNGTARVRKGDASYFVAENESTFIPVGELHSLENPGEIPLKLIEVQVGSYLGEDDVVRFEDRYGRTTDCEAK
jgi:mannose-1-phosphate guanylyltransferase